MLIHNLVNPYNTCITLYNELALNNFCINCIGCGASCVFYMGNNVIKADFKGNIREFSERKKYATYSVQYSF